MKFETLHKDMGQKYILVYLFDLLKIRNYLLNNFY